MTYWINSLRIILCKLPKAVSPSQLVHARVVINTFELNCRFDFGVDMVERRGRCFPWEDVLI